MKPIYVLNGPNLNRLGKREPEIYGTTTLAEVEALCREAAGDRPVVFHQTNSEQQLIEWVHEAIDEAAGILINPAAFTFTSLALLDAQGDVRPLEEIENEALRFAITHYRGQMSEVARRLRIGRSTLYRKLKDLGFDTESGEHTDENVASG